MPLEQYVNQGSFKASWKTARSCPSKNMVVEYSTAFDQVNKIVLVKWFDNAVVTLVSNFDFLNHPFL